MTREQIIQNIKIRISTIESYRPEERTLNEGNLFELKDLLLMIEKDSAKPDEVEETQEHFVIGSIAGSPCGPAVVCYTEKFAVGDEVIVQIRKKQ